MNQIIPAPLVNNFFLDNGIPARFSGSEIEQLQTTRPPERDGFVSFAIPADNRHLSVLGLRRLLGVDPTGPPFIFFDHPWYLEESFGDRPCKPGWHTVATAPLPSSFDQPIYYADGLAGEGLFLPTASEVVLMLFLALGIEGERLLLRKHTWTRDRTEARRFVSVGAFGTKGLFVSSHEVGYKSRGLGICPTLGA